MSCSPPEDPQRSAVYMMETAELGAHRLHQVPLHTLRKWARNLCKQYEVPMPQINSKKKRGYVAVYDPDTETIELHPKYGRNGLMLAHELAHHIVAHLHPRAADHGPRWMATYAELLDAMRLVPKAGARAIARRHNVRVANT